MIESVELGFSGKQQMLSTYKSLDSDPKTQNLLLKTVFKQNPHRLEAGTLNFAGIIGLKTALEWLVANFEDIEKYEQNLFEILKIEMHKLQKNGKIEVYVNLNLANKIPLVSFNLIGQNAFDVATLLDLKGFCVRSGQHCTGPLHDFVGINSSLRVSIGAWNTEVEILNFVRTLQSITN